MTRLLQFLIVITALASWGLRVGNVSAEELWIFDAHSHSVRGQNLEDVIARMDAAGVRKIVLFPRRQGTDDEVLRLHTKHPERVVPAVGFQNPGWLRQTPGFLDEVEAKLKSGRFRWMGELLLRHYGVPQLQAPPLDISPETALFQRVLDLSARYRVPVTVHHEADANNVDAFRRALSLRPDALVVWAHWCGRATPTVVRSFLEQLPNLACDLGAVDRTRSYGREKNPLLDQNGFLQPEWRAVFDAFPDRFLASIDAVEAIHYDRYELWAGELKKLLAQLRPEARPRIAYENAERLLARWTGSTR